jgi:uncharacterized protein YjlB
MTLSQKQFNLQKYYLKENGVFPNNNLLPVLLYKGILDLSYFYPAHQIKDLFRKNGWNNAWENGVHTFHHYHSITHEVMGIFKGETTLQLGGDDGIKITIQKGDVLVLPAGVAHKNLEKENQVKCVGAYPDGKNFDMNYGRTGERPKTDENIKKVSLPLNDPVFGLRSEMHRYWANNFP